MTHHEQPFHLLVMEDNPADRTLLEHLMHGTDRRREFHFVVDGVEAMEFLDRQGKYSEAPRPDLILLDLNVTRKDGRQTLAEIKRRDELRKIPVIVLTTSNNPQDIENAYALSANCYLTKPGELDEYAKLIQLIDDFWLSAAQLPSRSFRW